MASVIIKVTESCNACCVYCDVVSKPRPPVTRMPDDLVTTLFERATEYLAAHAEEHLFLTWHGGEPLLMGSGFYRRVRAEQDRLCRPVADRIHHNMQTNLTLLDDDLVGALRALGATDLGSSYEFLPGIRGLAPDRDCAGYRRRFLEGTRRADEAGLSWGLIYVVTKPALARPEEVLFHLTNLRPGGGLLLNPVLLYGGQPADLAVTPDEYADFLGAAFRLWWPRRERLGPVEPFASLVDTVVHRHPRLGCEDGGRCADTHVNLDPAGRVSQCGRAADWGLLDYGNLRERSLDEVFADPARERLRGRSARLAEGACRGCRFFPLCHGGCPLDGWAASGSLDDKTFRCSTRRRFLEEHLEPLCGVRYEGPGVSA